MYSGDELYGDDVTSGIEDEDQWLARRAAVEHRIRASEQHADDREEAPDNDDAYLEYLEDIEARDFYREAPDAETL